MAFRVGQKVVCVTNEVHEEGRMWRDDAPTVGAVYTVSHEWWRDGRQHLSFIELERHPEAKKIWAMCGKGRLGYGAWRFRPVTEKKTDISIFKAILNKENAKKSHPKKVEA